LKDAATGGYASGGGWGNLDLKILNGSSLYAGRAMMVTVVVMETETAKWKHRQCVPEKSKKRHKYSPAKQKFRSKISCVEGGGARAHNLQPANPTLWLWINYCFIWEFVIRKNCGRPSNGFIVSFLPVASER